MITGPPGDVAAIYQTLNGMQSAMQIEAKMTPDRRNRLIILVVMCVAFAAWFGYDGFINYPAKNLDWARQFLSGQAKESELEPNPDVTVAALKQVRDKIQTDAMTVEELTAQLGEPAHRDNRHLYYIGLATFASFEIEGDRVTGVERLEEQTEPSESDIQSQKIFGLILAVGALGVLVHLARVAKERVILDDEGLKIRGNTITWDEMESIDASRLNDKGFVTLSFQRDGQPRSVRLDSYALDRFDEMLDAIREKKGFHLKGAG
jgi:hypothetical protein